MKYMYGNQIILFCLQFNDIVETLAVKDEETEGKISFPVVKDTRCWVVFCLFFSAIPGFFSHSSR